MTVSDCAYSGWKAKRRELSKLRLPTLPLLTSYVGPCKKKD